MGSDMMLLVMIISLSELWCLAIAIPSLPKLLFIVGKRIRGKKIKKACPYHFWKPRNGVLAGGALHWLANRNPEADEANLMIAFDLSHEEFYQVPMPLAVGGGGFSACLEVLRGCLSLVCTNDI